MPELPEVETIKNELASHVLGRKICGVGLFWERIVRGISLDEFSRRIVGKKIADLKRRGKFLIFQLTDGEYFIIHLKVSGSLLVSRDSDEPPRFTRAVIYLDNGKIICFRDPRKFGRMWLTRDVSEATGKLGPEPLTKDFTSEVLAGILARRKAPIKAVLTDQNAIAGIGNMYADEALYAARVHPLRPASSLSPPEIKRLFEAIREILPAAIESKGASVVNYYRPGGEKGIAHFAFKVAHGLGGKTCSVCGGEIKRIVVRGRGSYFCATCQK